MVTVDVGANVGSLSAQYRAVGADVWAIEPDPRCWTALGAAVASGRLLGLAVADTEGTMTLHRSIDPAQNSLAAANVFLPQEDDLPPITVPVSTFDRLQALGILPVQIDAVKVDTQGSEAAILRGAERLLSTQSAIWYIELWNDGLKAAGDSVAACLKAFRSAGYHQHGYTGTAAEWKRLQTEAEGLHGHQSIDVCFVKG